MAGALRSRHQLDVFVRLVYDEDSIRFASLELPWRDLNCRDSDVEK